MSTLNVAQQSSGTRPAFFRSSEPSGSILTRVSSAASPGVAAEDGGCGGVEDGRDRTPRRVWTADLRAEVRDAQAPLPVPRLGPDGAALQAAARPRVGGVELQTTYFHFSDIPLLLDFERESENYRNIKK